MKKPDILLEVEKNSSDIIKIKSDLAESMQNLQSKDNYNKGIVTIIDDDGYNTFMTRWKPIADAQGIKLSIAVNPSFVGNADKLSLIQLKQLKSEGYDILSHSNTHLNMNTASIATIENDWNVSRQYLIDNELGDDLALVYPVGFDGVTDAQKIIDIKTTTRKYYKYGIDATTGTGVNILPVDNYEIVRKVVNPATVQLSTVQVSIDDAYNNGKWFIILTHSGASWDDATSPDRLNSIIDYIQSLGMPILNFRDAEALIGNVISHGDSRTDNYNFMCKNGATWSHSKRDYDVSDDKFFDIYSPTMPVSSMDALITEYAQYKVTTMQLTPSKDTFLNSGGVMSVFRGDNAYSYALFQPAQSSKVYKRIYKDSNNTWGAWTELNVPVSTAVATMDADITTYPTMQWTDKEVGGAKDTFLSAGGLLRIYRGSSTLSFQLYYPANSNSVYKRRYIEGTGWGTWEKISAI